MWTPCLLAERRYGKQRINEQLLLFASRWIDVGMVILTSYAHHGLLMKLFAKLQWTLRLS